MRPAEYEEKGVTRSTSLAQILAALDAALKKGGKSSRSNQIHETRGGPRNVIPPARTHSKDPRTKTVGTQIWSSNHHHQHFAKPEAWFLDVASPTWEDMREIGKVRLRHLRRRDFVLTYLLGASPSSPDPGGRAAA